MKRSPTPEEDPRVRRLLDQAGLPGAFRCTRLPGGGNNRVYRVDGAGPTALLKVYYTRLDDLRDRLGAETAFVHFLNQHRLAAAPRLLACDAAAGLALFEFIDGRKLAPGEVSRVHVAEAIEFALAINRHRSAPSAAALPSAAEACFSLEEHLACVQRRVERLAAIDASNPPAAEARKWVDDQLSPGWRQVQAEARRRAAAEGMALDAVLPAPQRCLSPSDFGFHNAILDRDKRLRFFDFEYAGWDDPAKLACDFFCQVQVPAPPDCWDFFVNEWAAGFPDAANLTRRIALLLPVYRVKWCCILLNEFLPADARRRRFSRNDNLPERRAAQLAKAREMLSRLGSPAP